MSGTLQKFLALINGRSQQASPVQVSAGSLSAGQIPALNASGMFDGSMLTTSISCAVAINPTSNGGVSVANSTDTMVSFPTVISDSGNFTLGVASPNFFTFPETGLYLVSLALYWTNMSAPCPRLQANMYIFPRGTTPSPSFGSGATSAYQNEMESAVQGGYPGVPAAVMMRRIAGDQLVISVNQNSGAAQQVNDHTSLSIVRLA